MADGMEAFRLFGSIFLKDQEARKELDEIDKKAKGTGKSFDDLEKKSSLLGGALKNALSFAGGLAIFDAVKTGFKESIGAGWEFNSQMQQSTAAFETMLGSTEKANKMLADLRNFSSVTPFELTDLTKASQTLLAFGQNAENIMPTLKMLGDVSLGNKEKFDGLTLAFAQVQSQGKLMGQDLLQMINNGFNPLQVLSEKTGKSMAQLKEEMSEGKISADMVTEAFKIATSEGGRFFNSMEKSSKTFSGLMSTLKDSIQMTMGQVLQPLFDKMTNEILPGIIAKTNQFQETYAKTGSLFTAITTTMGIDMGNASTLIQSNLGGMIERFSNLADKVMPSVQNIFNVITQQVIPTLANAFQSFATGVLPIIIDYWTSLSEKVIPPVVQIFEFIATEIIPKLAQSFQQWIPTIVNIMSGLRDIMLTVVDMVVKRFQEAWPYIQNIVRIAVDTITGVVGGLLQVLQGLINFIAGVFTGDWSRAWNGVKQIFQGVWDGIVSIAKGAINLVIAAFNNMIRGLNKLSFDIPDWIPGLGGKEFSLSIPQIPMLVEGGQIDKAGNVIVGENGPEILSLNKGARVTPLDKLDTLYQGKQITNNFNIQNMNVRNDSDVKKIAQELYNLERQVSRGRGFSFT